MGHWGRLDEGQAVGGLDYTRSVRARVVSVRWDEAEAGTKSLGCVRSSKRLLVVCPAVPR